MKKWLFALCFFAAPLYAGGQISVISSADNGAPPTGSTGYAHLQHGGYQSVTAWDVNASTPVDIIPLAGTISYFDVKTGSGTVPGGSGQYAFTVFKNGLATSLTCTMTATISSCTDHAHSFTTVAGDTVTLQSVPSSSPGGLGRLTWSLKFTANSTQQSLVMWGESFSQITGNQTIFAPLQGTIVANATEANVLSVMPESGTIRNLIAQTVSPPGGSGTFTITLDTGSAATAESCAFASTSSTCTDTSHSVHVNKGDLVSTRIVVSGAVNMIAPSISYEFDPDVDGESLGLLAAMGTQSQNATRFSAITGNGLIWTATENQNQSLAPACTIKNMYDHITGIASGQTDQTWLSVNTSTQALTVTVTGTATDGNDQVDSYATSDGDLITVKGLTSATTGTVRSAIGWVYFIATPASGGLVPLRTLLGVGP